ncbi:MAG: TPM domain-containing protein [Clostridia bacterium]|nr:TPM domain-containing protein [Clostridia bacterium]
MVRRMILLLLCALLPFAALADMAAVQVVDDAGVISDSMETRIAEVISRIEQEHQVDIVVLVTDDVPDDYTEELYRVQRFADDYYEKGGYGLGPDHSGMLYLIDLNNRVQYISTEGVMIDFITDSREEAIFDAAGSGLRSEDWGRAALAAMERTERFMAAGRSNGEFRYDEATGLRISGYYNTLMLHEILIALGAGAAVAAIMIASVAAAYGLKGGTYKYDVNANAHCELTQDEEQYLRETTSRVARSSSSGGNSGSGRRSGGSGVHRSSSGRSHGGGGRRF